MSFFHIYARRRTPPRCRKQFAEHLTNCERSETRLFIRVWKLPPFHLKMLWRVSAPPHSVSSICGTSRQFSWASNARLEIATVKKVRKEFALKKDALTKALYAAYEQTGRELHYWAGYFLRALKAHGGLRVAKSILAKRGKGALTKGFLNLVDAGRPDLSVEWIALLPEFRDKFSHEELRIAKERIRKSFRTPPPKALRASII